MIHEKEREKNVGGWVALYVHVVREIVDICSLQINCCNREKKLYFTC